MPEDFYRPTLDDYIDRMNVFTTPNAYNNCIKKLTAGLKE